MEDATYHIEQSGVTFQTDSTSTARRIAKQPGASVSPDPNA